MTTSASSPFTRLGALTGLLLAYRALLFFTTYYTL